MESDPRSSGDPGGQGRLGRSHRVGGARGGATFLRRGPLSVVPHDTVESARRTGVVLQGSFETPIGFGGQSANVTLRRLFETYATLRAVRDLVAVRENVAALYTGIEYVPTPGVADSLKLISRKGCEKIVRMAFEFSCSESRPTMHCATKSNIMKFREGLLKRTFEEIAHEYLDIESHRIIINNCAHQLVKRPVQFAVIITTNINGDIISDLSSALIGGLGSSRLEGEVGYLVTGLQHHRVLVWIGIRADAITPDQVSRRAAALPAGRRSAQPWFPRRRVRRLKGPQSAAPGRPGC
jgi:hypothetical protein